MNQMVYFITACRYLGKGVTKAVENINTIIAPALKVNPQ